VMKTTMIEKRESSSGWEWAKAGVDLPSRTKKGTGVLKRHERAFKGETEGDANYSDKHQKKLKNLPFCPTKVKDDHSQYRQSGSRGEEPENLGCRLHVAFYKTGGGIVRFIEESSVQLPTKEKVERSGVQRLTEAFQKRGRKEGVAAARNRGGGPRAWGYKAKYCKKETRGDDVQSASRESR